MDREQRRPGYPVNILRCPVRLDGCKTLLGSLPAWLWNVEGASEEHSTSSPRGVQVQPGGRDDALHRALEPTKPPVGQWEGPNAVP